MADRLPGYRQLDSLDRVPDSPISESMTDPLEGHCGQDNPPVFPDDDWPFIPPELPSPTSDAEAQPDAERAWALTPSEVPSPTSGPINTPTPGFFSDMGAVGPTSPNPTAAVRRVHSELNLATRAILNMGREITEAGDHPRLRRYLTHAARAIEGLHEELHGIHDLRELNHERPYADTPGCSDCSTRPRHETRQDWCPVRPCGCWVVQDNCGRKSTLALFMGGQKTVVLRARTEDFGGLEAEAQALSLATFMAADAGRTQVAPGSVTVLAIGGVSELVDQVSSKLSLY